LGGRADLAVEGGTGIDTVNLKMNAAVNGALGLTADLGLGNDKFLGTFDLTSFTVSATGQVVIDVDGGPGVNVFSASRNGTAGGVGTTMNGLLDLRFKGGASTDTMTVDFAGGGLNISSSVFRLRTDGGAGNGRHHRHGRDAGNAQLRLLDRRRTGQRQALFHDQHQPCSAQRQLRARRRGADRRRHGNGGSVHGERKRLGQGAQLRVVDSLG